MRETNFIAQNQEKWKRYEEALSGKDEDPELLRELYIHTTDDLSYSRTFYPNRSVRVYLNNLAQRTFLRVYRGRRGEASRFFSFWSEELPRVVQANHRALLVSLVVFLLAMLIGAISYRIDDQFAETIMGSYYMEMTEENIAKQDPMYVYKDAAPYGMALSITFNNIMVALLTFVSGVVFAIGSVVQLIRNGVMVGVFQYYFYDMGLLRESFLTIWMHGAIEISSIVIAGGAGITMGSGLLFPGTLSRLAAFRRSARDGVKIILGTIPLFIVAGIIEGYLTRHTELPDELRATFIILCFVFVIWYFYVYPRRVAARPVREVFAISSGEPGAAETFDPGAIRNLGGNLSATFTLLRRRLGWVFGGAAVLAVLFTCLSFWGFSGPAEARYTFTADEFGDFANFYELFSLSETYLRSGRGWTYLLLVAAYLAGCLYLAFQSVSSAANRPVVTPFRRGGVLAVTGLIGALIVAFHPGLVFLGFTLLLPLVIAAGYAAYLAETTGAGAMLKYSLRGFLKLVGGYILLMLLAIPTMLLLDTVLGQFVFNLIDWIFYVEEYKRYAINAVLQCGIYAFCSALLLITLSCYAAISAHSFWEVNEAPKLLERIRGVGRRGKLRGLEVER